MNYETTKMNNSKEIIISLKKKKAGLDVMQSHPLHRTQFQPIADTPPPRLHSRGVWQGGAQSPLARQTLAPQSRPQTPPSHKEKRSGEPSRISWASARFCNNVT